MPVTTSENTVDLRDLVLLGKLVVSIYGMHETLCCSEVSLHPCKISDPRITVDTRHIMQFGKLLVSV